MIVDKEWMARWFIKFNHAYFDGGLPLPKLDLSRSRTQLGTMAYRSLSRFGRRKLSDFTIRLTTYYDMTDFQAQNVLLHEMIHYSIAYTGLKDTSAHGVVFRGMADKFNKKYGWDIHVRTTTKGWTVAESVRKKKESRGPQTYLILALHTHEGRYFISRVNPKAYGHLNQLMRMSVIDSYTWYTTQDAYFADFPQVRSLRGRHISKVEYDRLVNVMHEFKG